MDLKKLLTRSISGLVYVAIIVGCILAGLKGVVALSIILGLLASLELNKIFNGGSHSNLTVIILDIAGVMCLCCGYYILPLLLWIFLILARFIYQLYDKVNNPVKSLSESMLTQLYIGLPLGLLVASAYEFRAVNIVLAMFLFIWINDTGAFIIGSLLGKHRLFERISPKKSWEGFWGGLLFNVGFAWLFCSCFSGFFELPENLVLWICWALIVSVFATWGDLVESMFKRHLGIKDSGNLIPGHGGILDRIDSLLFVAPASFIYFNIYFLYFF